MTACATATKGGVARPVVFPSKDKHGSYDEDVQTVATMIVEARDVTVDAARRALAIVRNATRPAASVEARASEDGAASAQ